MIWTLFFKIVGTAYAAYYCAIIGFDLSRFNKKNTSKIRNTSFEGIEINTSHLNALSVQVNAPIKASSVVPLHTAMNVNTSLGAVRNKDIVFDESSALDINNYLGNAQSNQTIDQLLSDSHTEMEDVASSIFDKYK